MYKYILFDLDGTITESDEGIIKSVQYALLSFGIHENDMAKLKKFVGPPLRKAFMENYNMTPKQAEDAITKYRERYSTVGMFECRVYDGVKDMFMKLKQKDCILVLATSKPKIYADKILKHFGLYDYFTFTVGCELDGTRDTKIEVMQYAIEKCNCPDKSAFIMIGDRFYDIDGANTCGIDSCGVLYGYGSKEELESAGATYICDTPFAVTDILTK